MTRRRAAAAALLGAVSGAVVLAGVSAATASAQLPATSGDPRIGLAAAWRTPGVALGLQHLANRPKPAVVNGTNSDLAFQGDYAFNGNYNGVNIYNIADPANPTLTTSISCPGSQNDVSVYQNLLFMSVESTAAQEGLHDDAGGDRGDPLPRHPHLRHLEHHAPTQVAGVQTCRGSHTHTLVRPKNDPANVYIYVQGAAGVRAATELAGCNSGAGDHREPVPVADRGHQGPARRPADRGDRQRAAPVQERAHRRAQRPAERPDAPQHPCRTTPPAAAVQLAGADYSPSPNTNHCHDITVYEQIDLAAGACSGNGLLIDISDPANPKRIDSVADPLSPTGTARRSPTTARPCCSRTSGAAAAPRAAARPTSSTGARTRSMRSSIASSSSAATTSCRSRRPTSENCVSHVGNLIPIPGRNVMVQAWYQGGISIVDWTDLTQAQGDRLLRPRPGRHGTSLVSGGFWSTYWYNGRIFGTEIARGFDSFKLTPTANLTAGEIASAERAAEVVRA